MEIAPQWRRKDYDLRFKMKHRDGSIESFPQTGIIYSYTVIQPESAPSGYEHFAPYVMAIVELTNGRKVTTRLTDLVTHREDVIINGEERSALFFDIEIGMPVEMVVRKIRSQGDTGLIEYGPAFRPILASEVSRSSK